MDRDDSTAGPSPRAAGALVSSLPTALVYHRALPQQAPDAMTPSMDPSVPRISSPGCQYCLSFLHLTMDIRRVVQQGNRASNPPQTWAPLAPNQIDQRSMPVLNHTPHRVHLNALHRIPRGARRTLPRPIHVSVVPARQTTCRFSKGARSEIRLHLPHVSGRLPGAQMMWSFRASLLRAQCDGPLILPPGRPFNPILLDAFVLRYQSQIAALMSPCKRQQTHRPVPQCKSRLQPQQRSLLLPPARLSLMLLWCCCSADCVP